ncbi:MAG: DUF2062 domain-containing protein [Sphingosinicella sp.]
MVQRIRNWIARNAPDREQLARSRWLKPVGMRVLRSEYWRFTRRSVPRGAAAGLFVGVFLLVPGVQIVGSTLLALPIRANIPVAAAMTFLTNPATTPFLLAAAMGVGSRLGFATDIATFQAMYERGASVSEWAAWGLLEAAPALAVGLFVIALASGAAGYILARLLWRWRIVRKWRRRGQRALVHA